MRQLLSQILCFIGLHRWDIGTSTHNDIVYDYARCRRSPGCRYAEWQCVNQEEVHHGST